MIVDVLSESTFWLGWLETVWARKRFPTSIFVQIPHMHLEVVLVWQNFVAVLTLELAPCNPTKMVRYASQLNLDPPPSQTQGDYLLWTTNYFYLQHELNILRFVWGHVCCKRVFVLVEPATEGALKGLPLPMDCVYVAVPAENSGKQLPTVGAGEILVPWGGSVIKN